MLSTESRFAPHSICRQTSSVLTTFQLTPGDLRENIVVDCEDLHMLPSGTTVRIGGATIRLTFHCEPCSRIADKVLPSRIMHQRGYLGCFLNQGSIRLNDRFEVKGTDHAPIPYDLRERAEWFLVRRSCPIAALEFLWETGLSASYARALPKLLCKLPASLQTKVVFANATHNYQETLPLT
jgi:MOSC domain-containing protein YiiM